MKLREQPWIPLEKGLSPNIIWIGTCDAPKKSQCLHTENALGDTIDELPDDTTDIQDAQLSPNRLPR